MLKIVQTQADWRDSGVGSARKRRGASVEGQLKKEYKGLNNKQLARRAGLRGASYDRFDRRELVQMALKKERGGMSVSSNSDSDSDSDESNVSRKLNLSPAKSGRNKYTRLSQYELQKECQRRQLGREGAKITLINRLLADDGASDDDEGWRTPGSKSSPRERERTRRRMQQKFDDSSTSELKGMLQAEGLRCSGPRKKLIARLVDHHAPSGAGDSSDDDGFQSDASSCSRQEYKNKFEGMKTQRLRKECKQNDLDSAGNREKLIKRLLAASAPRNKSADVDLWGDDDDSDSDSSQTDDNVGSPAELVERLVKYDAEQNGWPPESASVRDEPSFTLRSAWKFL